MSNHIQVIRLEPTSQELLERVLLPQQRLLFVASPTAQLEVYSGQFVTAFLEDRIPCANLIVTPEQVAS